MKNDENTFGVWYYLSRDSLNGSIVKINYLSVLFTVFLESGQLEYGAATPKYRKIKLDKWNHFSISFDELMNQIYIKFNFEKVDMGLILTND